MVMMMRIKMRSDTPLGALQKYLLEEEYTCRAGLSQQQRQVLQTLTRGHCGTWLVEWSPALKSLGLNPGSDLRSLSHAS